MTHISPHTGAHASSGMLWVQSPALHGSSKVVDKRKKRFSVLITRKRNRYQKNSEEISRKEHKTKALEKMVCRR